MAKRGQNMVDGSSFEGAGCFIFVMIGLLALLALVTL